MKERLKCIFKSLQLDAAPGIIIKAMSRIWPHEGLFQGECLKIYYYLLLLLLLLLLKLSPTVG